MMAFSFGKRGSKTKKLRKVARSKAADVKAAVTPADDIIHYPSPNPATNLVLADIVLRGAGTFARQGVERALLGSRYTPEKAKHVLEGRTLRQSLVGAALARVATRSVPGAIVVGGGMLAKTLYDRHRGKQATREGTRALAQQARRGR
jgi:hypothetical protein